MRNWLTATLIILCFCALFLVFYAPVLFQDRQFGFRDAGHYYYPLHERVQAEWNQGRWPLWEPEENAGMPLLGNPTAAVLYPGKLVFALLPYAWGARIYIVMHSALAFLTTFVLMRAWGTSQCGSALSALAYAFGAPILFQYCNIIYLVGAAWLPLGVHAVDGWIRLGRRLGLLELAIVLSMQVLGGDPQAAYLLGLASIGYAGGTVWARARSQEVDSGAAKPGLFRFWSLLLQVLIVLVVWFVATVALAHWLPTWRGPGSPRPPLRWMPWFPLGVTVVWVLIAMRLVWQWRGRFWRYPLGAMCTGLAISAALAVGLAAAQVLPVIEFTQQTGRATDEGLHDLYQFSTEPFRLAELAWPNILGIPFESKGYWSFLIKTPGGRPTGWVPSLYMGGLTCALALGSLLIRRGPRWRVWLTVIAAVCLLGSLGKYVSPIWIARAVAVSSDTATVRSWLPEIGPLDPVASTPIRADGYLRDGDGGIYWWLTAVLPGFRQFRFPAKLFTFTALAISALAGLAWDRAAAGRARGIATSFLVLLAATLVTLGAVLWQREPILASFRGADSHSIYGPFNAAAGYRSILLSLSHAATVFGLGLGLVLLARKRPHLAGSAALIVMTADLATGNARHILTVPQSVFERKPEVLKIIEAAERARPSPGPFRIHRMPIWHPMGWDTTPSHDRINELTQWESDTLQPKYGINFGVEYTQTIGVAQLYEYDRHFIHFPANVHDRQLAVALGVNVGAEVEYYLRRAYNLWNTRYFVVPFFGNGWRDATRASASFVFESELIYPPSDRFTGPNGNAEADRWIDTRDFRVLRNLQEYPRAWVVHRARPTLPDAGRSRWALSDTLQEILYANDAIWNDSPRRVHDPRNVAWLSKDDLKQLRLYLSGQTTTPSESVDVAYPSPQRVVLEVSLDSPGLVILADVYYPGWYLAIDGQPAQIYRVNGLMRGAAVGAGRHRLEYTYSPRSFRVGGLMSIVGLTALLILGLVCAKAPIDPVLAESS